MTDWGAWLKSYPQAVAYRMFDAYQAVNLPDGDNPNSVRSRGIADSRLRADERIFGVWTGTTAKAYPLYDIARAGALVDQVGGTSVVVLWDPTTKTAAAYRPIASQPRKYKAPAPDAHGISKPDDGVPMLPGTPVMRPPAHDRTGVQTGLVHGRRNQIDLGHCRPMRRGPNEGLDARLGRRRPRQMVRLGGRASEHRHLRQPAMTRGSWPAQEAAGERHPYHPCRRRQGARFLLARCAA